MTDFFDGIEVKLTEDILNVSNWLTDDEIVDIFRKAGYDVDNKEGHTSAVSDAKYKEIELISDGISISDEPFSEIDISESKGDKNYIIIDMVENKETTLSGASYKKLNMAQKDYTLVGDVA
ncbi:hypothetical protein HBP99_12145 [Listeria booriae]|uniref:hypothetical protein n=1 Tax=Listeria booriae TaxID=1552123 RepID=UPI00162A8AF5|nr:hypothetical protein [Listeria booriae]MBC2369389.1 hypothetical protein [Listeria booriae]